MHFFVVYTQIDHQVLFLKAAVQFLEFAPVETLENLGPVPEEDRGTGVHFGPWLFLESVFESFAGDVNRSFSGDVNRSFRGDVNRSFRGVINRSFRGDVNRSFSGDVNRLTDKSGAFKFNFFCSMDSYYYNHSANEAWNTPPTI